MSKELREQFEGETGGEAEISGYVLWLESKLSAVKEAIEKERPFDMLASYSENEIQLDDALDRILSALERKE